MKKRLLGISILFIFAQPSFANNALIMDDTVNIMEISQELLLAAKTGEPTDSLVSLLKNIPPSQLKQLNTDDEKKAFWINLYNAYTQLRLKQNPGMYRERNKFFKDKVIRIAGKALSLDDIEHGILRRSKIKWSLGYLNKLFPSVFEKETRVHNLDKRIHFALNCGAKSCPPIAFYKPLSLDKELDLATSVYLKGEAEYDSTNNTVYLPAIMSWFRRDFGGKRKMLVLLKKLDIIPADKTPAIKFKKYNWDLFLENYQTK